MPIIAALILTELIIQAIKTKSPLYVALMDARKAFDIVWHLGLMREMHKFGLTGDNWLFFKRWYENLKSKIKWKGLLSNSIEEQQGVRQGGIWSPTAYKIFINSLLQTFERNQLGACIGPIYCGIPTVADDVALISTDPYELQTMLNVQADHANKLRYLLSEQKSTILVYNDKLPKSWSLNGKSVTLSESAVHLGIDRNITKNAGVKEVVNKRRIPIEGEIHKKILKTFGNIIRNDKSVEREIAFRQLAMKDEKSGSWFTKLHNLTVIYGLPSPYDIIENPPSKISWNRLVNNCINNHFLQNLKKEAKEKSSLKYINFNDSNIGTVHNIWKSSGTDPYSINMAAIKVKIATGIMILQYQRSRFSKNCISAICPLCNIEPEDMTHFILKCEKLSSIRNRFMQELKSLLVDCNKPPLLIQELFDDKENLLHLIIDCTSYHFLTYKEQVRIETLTRGEDDDFIMAKYFSKKVLTHATEDEQKEFIVNSMKNLREKKLNRLSNGQENELTNKDATVEKSKDEHKFIEHHSNAANAKDTDGDVREDYATSAKDKVVLGETTQENEDIITILDGPKHNLLTKLVSIEEIHKQWLQVDTERLEVDKRRLEVEKLR
ncbi:unnamed protein product [Mytilus edulis]|uniref:Reverse transcriptase domain-containing protein n=1 Tax=Mytilus edulis TaxID=6550 RepID=A0A8S3RE96_MYTED|nr:unnamed protein product [Mytilus edulis]